MAPKRPARDLLVAGHVNVDRHLLVPRFPGPDSTEPVLEEREELGGTATTLARVASRLGVRTGILARVGSGFPASYLRLLRSEGVDLRGVSVVRGAPTPCCTILADPSGATRTVIQQGPMADGRRAPLPGAWGREYSWVHLATGDPSHYLAVARWARAAGLRVAVDPAQEIFYRWDRAKFLKLLAYAETLFGNRREIDHAARFAGGGVEELLARVPLVVRTDGPDGATAFSRAGTVKVRAARPRRVRTLVGAGDAFRGGFYAAWFRGEPLRDCLVAGSASARRRIEDGP